MDFDMDNRSNSSAHPPNWSVNKMLLTAVLKEDIEEVQRLVKHPGLNLNYQIDNGDTLLHKSLHIRNEPIFMSLLNAGCDVNISNVNNITPLHEAVMYLPINFAHELVKRGATIEAVDIRGRTPLCTAVFYGNVEVVCMLLYYGADVTVTCSKNMTPFMWALRINRVEISKILFSYYDDFSCVNDLAQTALYIATRRKHPIAVNILKAGTEKTEHGDALLIHSVGYNTAEVFKLIWSKFKQEIRLNAEFLTVYVKHCNFSNSEWLKCWHLLFKSPTAFEHLQQGKTIDKFNVVGIYRMIYFVKALHNRNMELKDRLALIYLLLSFGINPSVDSINLAYIIYGFNEELEAFIYTFNNERQGRYSFFPFSKYSLLPLPRFILLSVDEYQMKIHFGRDFYADFLERILVGGKMDQDVIVEALNFCSLSYTRKQRIKKACQREFKYPQRLIEKLNVVPEVPSLLELCRNETRKLLIKSGKIKKPYQFHDIVKELNLPLRIRDIIRLKIPIY